MLLNNIIYMTKNYTIIRKSQVTDLLNILTKIIASNNYTDAKRTEERHNEKLNEIETLINEDDYDLALEVIKLTLAEAMHYTK